MKKKYGGGSWIQIYSGNSLTITRIAKTSGFWDIRAIAKINGIDYTSTIESVEEMFPSFNTISSNSTVSNAFNQIWLATKNQASSNGRQKKGAWVYLNTATGQYDIQNVPDGPLISCSIGTGGTILVPPPNGASVFSPLDQPREYVAFFHTHTPLTYCPSNIARVVGPSPSDYKTDYVSIVYDYVGTIDPVYGRVVIGGHNINAVAEKSYSGAIRRLTRMF